jgi:hypothetical protein
MEKRKATKTKIVILSFGVLFFGTIGGYLTYNAFSLKFVQLPGVIIGGFFLLGSLLSLITLLFFNDLSNKQIIFKTKKRWKIIGTVLFGVIFALVAYNVIIKPLNLITKNEIIVLEGKLTEPPSYDRGHRKKSSSPTFKIKMYPTFYFFTFRTSC